MRERSNKDYKATAQQQKRRIMTPQTFVSADKSRGVGASPRLLLPEVTTFGLTGVGTWRAAFCTMTVTDGDAASCNRSCREPVHLQPGFVQTALRRWPE